MINTIAAKYMLFKVQYVINTWCMNQIGHFKVWGVYVLGGICPRG